MEHTIRTVDRSGSTRGRMSPDNDPEGIRARAKKASGYCQPVEGVNSKARMIAYKLSKLHPLGGG